MLFPFPFKLLTYGALGLRVDDVHFNWILLQKPLNAGYRLYPLIKLEVYSEKNDAMALLQVHTSAIHHGLTDKSLGLMRAPLGQQCFTFFDGGGPI